MQQADPSSSAVVSASPTSAPHEPSGEPTPLAWRVGIGMAVLAIGGAAFALRSSIGLRGQAFAGILCFFGLVAMFSSNLRRVRWRTIGWGIVLQIILAVLVLK